MKNYIVHNAAGKILRTGTCPDRDFLLQAKESEFIIEGVANDLKEKIVDGKIAKKTPQEIIVDTPKPIPFEKMKAQITNEAWQEVLDRISVLESEV